jgi:gluconate 5-dehydrogenase
MKSYLQRLKEQTSIGRWGRPEDLRGVIVFLAGPASDFVTGERLVVDGVVLGRYLSGLSVGK